MALSAPRSPSRRGNQDFATFAIGIGANLTIFRGAMVDKAATGGFAKAGATNTTDKCLGVAMETKVAGAVAGATSLIVAKGIWNMRNSGADPVTAADIGNDCFVVDDETVAKTNGTSTRHVAGKVWDVRADGSIDVHFIP